MDMTSGKDGPTQEEVGKRMALSRPAVLTAPCPHLLLVARKEAMLVLPQKPSWGCPTC